MTQAQIADVIGMKVDRRGATGGRYLLLKGNGPGGTYTASLIRRGLVMAVKRYARGRPKGKARQANVYLLTTEAISILERSSSHGQDAEPDRNAAAGATA